MTIKFSNIFTPNLCKIFLLNIIHPSKFILFQKIIINVPPKIQFN
jgi:hypothetical protein